jgi:hypothetical protein
MKQKNTFKVWQFKNGENTLHTISNLHLVIWNKGIAIIGYTENKEVSIAKYFLFDHTMDAAAAIALLIDEPLLGGDEPVTNIWLSHSSLLIIPKKYYKEGVADQWIKQFQFIAQDESILALPVNKPASYIVFPIETSLKEQLLTLFPNALIDNLINASFSDNTHKNMTLSVLPQFATIATFDTTQLLHYTAFEFDTIDDIIYKIAYIANHHHIPAEQLKLDIVGFGEEKDKVANALAGMITIDNKPESSFFNLLLTCE